MNIEVCCYILILNLCALFLLYIITKNVLDFFFFIDKPKSFKRTYRKSHNFLYKSLFGFVYNKRYIQQSKYRKHIIGFYLFYLSLTVCGFILMLTGLGCFGEMSLDFIYKYFEMAYIAIVLVYLIWYRLHCKGKGYIWWLPATWWKGSFYINIK